MVAIWGHVTGQNSVISGAHGRRESGEDDAEFGIRNEEPDDCKNADADVDGTEHPALDIPSRHQEQCVHGHQGVLFQNQNALTETRSDQYSLTLLGRYMMDVIMQDRMGTPIEIIVIPFGGGPSTFAGVGPGYTFSAVAAHTSFTTTESLRTLFDTALQGRMENPAINEPWQSQADNITLDPMTLLPEPIVQDVSPVQRLFWAVFQK